jgi:hypothetical protein
MPRSVLGRLALVAALVGSVAAAAVKPALAAPLLLADEAALDRLAALVTAYKDTSRVRWVIEARDPADRARVLSGLAERLGAGRSDLLERVTAIGPVASTRSLAPARGTAETDGPTAHIAFAPAPDRPCSWRVTVADPAAPMRDRAALVIPLERGDVVPTSADATFEVGFAGPLQSTLYAFAETAPGALRDLAAAPEIAIPVESSAAETLVLVRARRPVPFLDGIRNALGEHAGERAELGRNAALGERFRNGGRGIGANIQLVDPGMIVAQVETPPQVEPAPEADEGASGDVQMVRSDDLVETCLYTVTRLPG